jgi:adenine deaminase
VKPSADILIRNGTLIDPIMETATRTDISIRDGRIFSFRSSDAEEIIDATGCLVSCGFIESHLHVEGLHLLPEHYFHAFLSHGTTAIVTDLHEIANAGGMSALAWYLSLIDDIPLDIFLMAPSCVPSSRFELGFAKLGFRELKALKGHKRVVGLGEVMDVEAVKGRQERMMRKIALFEGRPVDGHAPGLTGAELDLYLSAGIHSDHETTSLDEGAEKLKAGMHLFLRQGSAASDLPNLIPLIRQEHLARLSLCADDLSARDLTGEGHLDRMVGRLVRAGIPLFHALRLVTANPALYFGLSDRGSPGVGKRADLVIFDRPEEMRVRATVKNGRLVYREGSVSAPSTTIRPDAPAIMNVAPFSRNALRQKARGSRIRVMGVRDGSIIVEDIEEEARIEDGYLAADRERDILLAYAFDRYRREEKYGFGFVRGFSLKEGAIGTTYAHDSHNLVIVGDNGDDIHRVLRMIEECGGGMAASQRGVQVCLPMPFFGIISALSAPDYLRKEAELEGLVRKMGVRLRNPFFQMSFISLPVIPHLRLTTKGLFDVSASRYVEANYV